MCQVLRSELCSFDWGVNLNTERVEGALERSCDGAQCRERGETGAQETIVAPGEEQGDVEDARLTVP
jgi:hypothetical protein